MKPYDANLMAWWSFNEGQGYSVVDCVNQKEDPIAYVFNHAHYKPSTEPLWRTGITGSALLFDGYSTWVTRSANGLKKPTDGLTIEAWIAPRAYEWGDEQRLSAIINQHHREACQGYILGVYRHGSWGLQLAIANTWVEAWANECLPVNQWSYIAATFCRKTALIHLYLNGKLVATRKTPKGNINPCNSDVLIGRNNQATRLDQAFYANMFSGLIDDLKVYDRALTGQEIVGNYTEYLVPQGGTVPRINLQELALDRTIYEGDLFRPQFHLIPPGHWMNEPHAPFYFNGKYHIFYQHNPHGPFWHQIHWGHLISEDMVHWRDLPVALTPESVSVDPDGCWSGSATFDQNGIPVIFYTAGDEREFPNQRTALARSTYLEDQDVELRDWVKHPKPVTIQRQGQGELGNFRDPFVWRQGDFWYQLVGAGIKEQGGTALVYTSRNLVDWEYKGPLFISDYCSYPYLGTMWELPVLLPIGQDQAGKQKHILLVLPWGEGSKIDVFYWIGHWNETLCRFLPDQQEPQLIDIGDTHFTGPSGLVTPDGRTVIFTIAQGKRLSQHEYNAGWAHNGGLPIEVKLRADGRLGVEPIFELQSLREKSLISLKDQPVAAVNQSLQLIKGDMLEVNLELENISATAYGLYVRQSPDRQEETLLYFDQRKNSFNIDRNKTSLDPEVLCSGIQGGLVDIGSENLKLKVYLDKSMVEAYINGLKSLTSRVYPTRPDALGLQIWADGEIIVKVLKIWQLQSAY